MKIVEVTFTLAPGGAERFVIDLSNELSKEHEVSLLLIKHLDVEGEQRDFYLQEVSSRIKQINLNLRDGFSFSTLWKIYRAIKKTQADIVHIHGEACPKFCIVALTLLSCRMKFVQTIHSDITQYNDVFYKVLFNTLGRWNKIMFAALSRTNYNDLTRMHPYLKASCIENGRTAIKRTPLFEDVRKEIDSYKKDSDTKIILHVGRLGKEKNQQLLIEAMRALEQKEVNAQLLIIGPYFDSEEGQKLLDTAPSNVYWLGTRKNVGDYHLCADVFALSSVYEGMPITLLEASLAGTPAVSTPVCGAIDIIEDGKNGRLSKDHTLNNYTAALEDVIVHNAEYAQRASSFVTDSPYTIERCARKYIDLFQA